MKLSGNITINNRNYPKGSDIPKYQIYPFFMVHMLIFGGSGFFMAYSDTGPPVHFLYAHGGIAIAVYMVFYLIIFGRDEVKWMFIRSAVAVCEMSDANNIIPEAAT